MTGKLTEVLISTIVPAFNEAGNIDEFCRQFDEMQKTAGFKSELVIVDDGSSDETFEKIKSNAAKYSYIRFARHHRNLGLTAALQTGFDTAAGEVYVFYPADLQYKPEDIPKLVAPIGDGADIVTGRKEGKYQKRFVSEIYNYLSRKIFRLKVHDLNSVKAFRREVVKQVFLRRDWHRYMVVLAANLGFRVEEVAIPLYERQWGQSGYTIWRIPGAVLDMVAVLFQLFFLRKPLLYFGLMGSFFLFIGFLVGLWAVYLKYVQAETQLPLLYLVILLTGIGLGLFMMGFISEGQTAVKEEVTDLRRKVDSLLDHVQKKKDDLTGG